MAKLLSITNGHKHIYTADLVVPAVLPTHASGSFQIVQGRPDRQLVTNLRGPDNQRERSNAGRLLVTERNQHTSSVGGPILCSATGSGPPERELMAACAGVTRP